MKEYRPRIADEILNRQLSSSGAVLIEGAKWCGKTSTAEQQAKSVLYMDDPENSDQNITLAKASPVSALAGETPRLIDEWQLVPKLWDAVRFEVDHRDNFGQFILTGSATPTNLSSVHHSGIGRITRLLMRPMSLYESGESTGEVSLKALFDSPDQIIGTAEMSLDHLAFVTCRGGWPKAVNIVGKTSLSLANNYYNALVESDISRADNVNRSPVIAERVLRSYARSQGSQISLESMRKDVDAGDDSQLGLDTVRSYIEALRKIYVIEDVPAWNPNLRSKAAIRTSDTRYFVDPSIATTALGVNPEGLINDLHSFGFIFETLCIRDLRVYAEVIDGRVSHYLDSNGVECDAVIHLRNGKYGLVQMKLGADNESIEQAASRLKAMNKDIDTNRMYPPSFMLILTGNGRYAYRRPEDGVYVVPIGCLKY